MKETLFTKISNREIPAYIIDENDEFIAFLDIFPATYGQTLVVPKIWHDSYVFKNNDEFIARLMSYAKSIALKLDKALGSIRCRVLFEGLAVDHLHAKLYPVMSDQANDEGFDFRNTIEFNDTIAKEILEKLGK